jgi:hypothetical protein
MSLSKPCQELQKGLMTCLFLSLCCGSLSLGYFGLCLGRSQRSLLLLFLQMRRFDPCPGLLLFLAGFTESAGDSAAANTTTRAAT